MHKRLSDRLALRDLIYPILEDCVGGGFLPPQILLPNLPESASSSDGTPPSFPRSLVRLSRSAWTS